MSTVFLLFFLMLAATNWLAAWRGQTGVEYIVKPAALAALILFAVSGGQASPWLMAALTLCLLGDVYLMLPGNYFIAGLVAFLLGHVAYVVGFPGGIVERLPWSAAAAVLTLPVTIPVLRSIKEVALKAGVVAYMAVICLMAGSAVASGSLTAAVAALLFVVSDSILAWDMFVRKLPRAHFWVMVTYHASQLGLVLALQSL
ncbi:MAG TPA: lysoplasmalogenase [Candidatus Obscuribacterales bacterium]